VRKFGQAKYETLLQSGESTSRTAIDGIDRKVRLVARIRTSGEFDSEVGKDETYGTK
jgi:hypothetical protein